MPKLYAFILVLVASYALAGCPPNCPAGETLQTTGYSPYLEPDAFVVPAGTTYCDTDKGWERFQAIGDTGVVLDAARLVQVATTPGSRRTYEVAARSIHEYSSQVFTAWLECGQDEQAGDGAVQVRYADTDRATPGGLPNHYNVPFHRGSDAPLSPYSVYTRGGNPFPGSSVGVCVANRSGRNVRVRFQRYLPTLECRPNAAVPTPPAAPSITCTRPSMTDPMTGPACSNPRDGVWAVPVANPDTGCATAALYYATSAGEAQACARASRLETPDQICDYAIQLYDDAGTKTIYRSAADAEHAITCARSECSTCSPQITAQGVCAGPARVP